MSMILQEPDAVSFSGNLKKLVISSETNVSFQLAMGATEILDAIYTPRAGDLVEIDLRETIHRLLSVMIPDGSAIATDQTGAIAEFTATIDTVPITFKVIRGGVLRLKQTAADWLAANNLSWQPQDKAIIFNQPEFLSLYAAEALTVKVKAYFADGTTEQIDLATLAAEKVWSVAVDWTTIDTALTGNNPVAWDVWKVNGAGTTVGFVQRYRLRNTTDSENRYVWANTLGGVDSVSMTGYKETDEDIEHQVMDIYDETLEEYDNKKKEKVRQSTGWMGRDESLWLKDFFLSPEKYEIDEEGDLRRIALSESKVIASTMDDQHDYELTFRYSDERPLLNIRRTTEAVPDFIPGEITLPRLIRDLPPAAYSPGMVIAVQDPTSPRWYQMTIEQFLTYIEKEGTPSTGSGAGTRLLSGTISWKSGLTYHATDLEYEILGEPYTATARDITLTAADPNLARKDIFVADRFGNVFAVAGDPSVDPIKPTAAYDELEVTHADIPAGAVEPSNIEMVTVYDEGAEGEWTGASTADAGITVNLADTTNPANGTKHASITLNIPPETGESPTRKLGAPYYNGAELVGYIYWLDTTGKKGWVVAPAPVSMAAPYQYSRRENGTQNNTAIGMGPTNTDIMMAISNSNQAGMAAPLCVQYRGGGLGSWCLGARNDYDQIRSLVRNGTLKGYSPSLKVWSSTESVNKSDREACAIDFARATGNLNREKGTALAVIPVVYFDDTQQSYTTPVEQYSPVNTLIDWTAPADAITLEKAILLFQMGSSKEWLGDTTLLIESFNGDFKTGGVQLKAANAFGYDSTNPDNQLCTIHFYNFGLNGKEITRLRMRPINTWPNGIRLDIDQVRIQYDPNQEVVTEDWETKENKVSAWSEVPDDTHYPTEKLVKESVDLKLDITQMLGEFDTEEKKYQARENLGLNIIDGGTF